MVSNFVALTVISFEWPSLGDKGIHTEFGCEHFRTFLNRYRIEQVISLMKDPKKGDEKLIAIAFDSGFASLASFQRAFKRETGVTASQWRDREI